MFTKSILASVLSLALVSPITAMGLDFAQLNDIPACSKQSKHSDKSNSKAPCNAILVFKDGDSIENHVEKMKNKGASIRHSFKAQNVASAHIPNLNVLEKLLESEELVEILPDRKIEMTISAQDMLGITSESPVQQIIPPGVSRIGAAPGKLSFRGQGIGIAIIDTGVDLTNADLRISPVCFKGIYSSCKDENGHGTHVAGIAAAVNNGIDVVGVAPESTVYAVRALGPTGSGTDSDIMAGLEWVAENASQVVPAIRVVNLSIGRPGTLNDNPYLRASFQKLKDLGIISVVSAGNTAKSVATQMVPATYPEVISVASTAAATGSNSCRSFSGSIKADTASYFTTDGAYNPATQMGISISAPGEHKENISRNCTAQSVGIPSLKRGGGIVNMSGTSMAAPHVAGVCALLIQQNPGLYLDGVRTLLRTKAASVGVAPLNSPTANYTFDGEREGIVSACLALGQPC